MEIESDNLEEIYKYQPEQGIEFDNVSDYRENLQSVCNFQLDNSTEELDQKNLVKAMQKESLIAYIISLVINWMLRQDKSIPKTIFQTVLEESGNQVERHEEFQLQLQGIQKFIESKQKDYLYYNNESIDQRILNKNSFGYYLPQICYNEKFQLVKGDPHQDKNTIIVYTIPIKRKHEIQNSKEIKNSKKRFLKKLSSVKQMREEDIENSYIFERRTSICQDQKKIHSIEGLDILRIGQTTYLVIQLDKKKSVVYNMKDILKIEFQSTFMMKLREKLLELEGPISLNEQELKSFRNLMMFLLEPNDIKVNYNKTQLRKNMDIDFVLNLPKNSDMCEKLDIDHELITNVVEESRKDTNGDSNQSKSRPTQEIYKKLFEKVNDLKKQFMLQNKFRYQEYFENSQSSEIDIVGLDFGEQQYQYYQSKDKQIRHFQISIYAFRSIGYFKLDYQVNYFQEKAKKASKN